MGNRNLFKMAKTVLAIVLAIIVILPPTLGRPLGGKPVGGSTIGGTPIVYYTNDGDDGEEYYYH